MKCFKKDPKCFCCEDVPFAVWWQCYVREKTPKKITAFSFWCDAIRCLAPKEPLVEVNRKYEQLLNNYSEAFTVDSTEYSEEIK